MVFTFGGNGFFGYASGSPADQNNLMWWSTWEVADPPTGANLDTSEIKKQMQERHAHWRDPVVREIVSEADVGSVYPTWVLDDLPTWGEKGLVLVGDAAHALSPTTGQGASQALEDSQTLALALAMRLQDVYAERGRASETADGEDKDETGAVAQAIKLYQDVRSPRVKEIAERGRKMDGSKVKAGMVKEYIMYLFLWILNRYPSLGTYVWLRDARCLKRSLNKFANACIYSEEAHWRYQYKVVRMERARGAQKGVGQAA